MDAISRVKANKWRLKVHMLTDVYTEKAVFAKISEAKCMTRSS
jgi:hypothetical protein